MAKHNQIGRLGESIAANFIKRRGDVILKRNFLKKVGEIDIVYRDGDGVIHFVEVKSVSFETTELLKNSVSHETWRPEDNVHSAKRLRLARTIEIWLAENERYTDYVVDVVTVKLVPREKYAEIATLENILLLDD